MAAIVQLKTSRDVRENGDLGSRPADRARKGDAELAPMSEAPTFKMAEKIAIRPKPSLEISSGLAAINSANVWRDAVSI